MSFGPFRFENIDVPSISFLTSSKAHTLGHKFRLGIHQALKRIFNDELKILNLKTPPRIDSKDIVFIDSMFSIVVENERQNN